MYVGTIIPNQEFDQYLGWAIPTGEGITPEPSEFDYYFFIRDGDLILLSSSEVPDYEIRNGELIYTYNDGETPPDLNINSNGYLTVTT